MKFCGNLQYEVYKAKSFVYKQNDECNNKFYVILSGQVGVIVNNNLHNLKKRPTMTHKTVAFANMIPSIKVLSQTDDAKANAENKKPEENTKRLNFGRRNGLRFGENFGTAVSITMTVKKMAQRARNLVVNKVKSNAQSMQSLDEVQNNSDNEFKEHAGNYGELVRMLSKGTEFGDFGNFRRELGYLFNFAL